MVGLAIQIVAFIIVATAVISIAALILLLLGGLVGAAIEGVKEERSQKMTEEDLHKQYQKKNPGMKRIFGNLYMKEIHKKPEEENDN